MAGRTTSTIIWRKIWIFFWMLQQMKIILRFTRQERKCFHLIYYVFYNTCTTTVPCTSSQSPCTALMAGKCLPLGLFKGTLSDLWKMVEILTVNVSPKSIVTEAIPTYTVETLYSTIYYSKYFIELNFDKSTQYVALWTHKRHPIPRPFGRAMECLLWVFQQKLTVL